MFRAQKLTPLEQIYLSEIFTVKLSIVEIPSGTTWHILLFFLPNIATWCVQTIFKHDIWFDY